MAHSPRAHSPLPVTESMGRVEEVRGLTRHGDTEERVAQL